MAKPAVCRVHVPASYITVEKRVLVKRGRRWAEHTPSAVAYVEQARSTETL